MTPWLLVPVLVLALSVAGCAQTDEGTGATDSQPLVAQATTTTAFATTTAADSTPSDPAEPWDLLYLGDHYGARVAIPYGEHAGEAIGIPVKVHDQVRAHLSIAEALESLRDERYPQLADVARNAEIIVIGPGPWDMESVGPGFEACEFLNTVAPEPYTVTDWKPFREALQLVYDEIWELREGQPTVLIATDWHNVRVSRWKDRGIDAVCAENMVSLSTTIRDAAEANGATMVSLYDLFNGPDHQDDPKDKGWVQSTGAKHNEAGAQAIADALAAAGFEPDTRP